MNIFYECIFTASNFLKIHLFAVIDIEHIKCHKKEKYFNSCAEATNL